MSLGDDSTARELLEHAFSAASEEDRALLNGKLADRPADEQRKWSQLLTEFSALRIATNDVPMPEGLQSRLMNLLPPPTRLLRRMNRIQVRHHDRFGSDLSATSVGSTPPLRCL